MNTKTKGKPGRDSLRLVGAAEHSGISSMREILDDFARGEMVILVDDENRENEGDLIIAAQDITPQAINFMASHGRGLICLTLTQECCERLRLPRMVAADYQDASTNFTVSIEAARGVTTGISAADRATTVLAAVRPAATAADLTMPGHIFPVMAQPGGVLSRAGHTEAGVDLARLAGKQPASVICEVLNTDGTMARLPDLLRFGEAHGIKVGSIADIIRHRLAHEPTVQRVAHGNIATRYGDFRVVAYHDLVDGLTHMALVLGDIDAARPELVRVHVSTGLYDVLADLRDERTWSLEKSMKKIAAQGSGVVVVLCYPEDGQQLVNHIRRSQLQDQSDDEAEDERAYDLRTFGLGCQILLDTGVRRMRVMGAPKRTPALSGFDLEIVEFVGAE